jgi:hypothetical protein
MGEIAANWAKPSAEEQVEVTEEKMKTLQDNRENRLIGRHNVSLAAFHNTCLTFNNVVQEVSAIFFCCKMRNWRVNAVDSFDHADWQQSLPGCCAFGHQAFQ